MDKKPSRLKILEKLRPDYWGYGGETMAQAILATVMAPHTARGTPKVLSRKDMGTTEATNMVDGEVTPRDMSKGRITVLRTVTIMAMAIMVMNTNITALSTVTSHSIIIMVITVTITIMATTGPTTGITETTSVTTRECRDSGCAISGVIQDDITL
ncbi:hypothetical protein OSTOST_04564 [Ostertagia ostertagi]